MEDDVNWQKCIICQKSPRTGVLTNPKNEKGKSDAENLAKFQNLHNNLHKLWNAGLSLPKVLLPKTLGAETMYEKNCVWHRCCRNEYSDTLTERLLKQHKKENPAPPEPVPQPDEQTPKRARVRFQNTCSMYGAS